MAVDVDLERNYRALKASRGVSWAQLAGETTDRGLIAWMREQHAAETAADRQPAPQGRQRAKQQDA